tara:strand:- start:313 stop:597 length:285 start_codon:yes stop_codon:yes gene_type:complete
MTFFNHVYAAELLCILAVILGLYLGVEKNLELYHIKEFDVNDITIQKEFLGDGFPSGEFLPSVPMAVLGIIVCLSCTRLLPDVKMRTSQMYYHS